MWANFLRSLVFISWYDKSEVCFMISELAIGKCRTLRITTKVRSGSGKSLAELMDLKVGECCQSSEMSRQQFAGGSCKQRQADEWVNGRRQSKSKLNTARIHTNTHTRALTQAHTQLNGRHMQCSGNGNGCCNGVGQAHGPKATAIAFAKSL